MDVKNILKSQATFSCLRDLSEDDDDLLHFNGVVDVTADRAEECCSREVSSHPTDVTTCHTGNWCLNTQDSGTPQSLADVQACKTGLGRSLTTNSLLGEQADTSVGNHSDSRKCGSENSAAVLEICAEKVTSVSDDFSDDDLEYFECSDVLTVHEDEIWKKKLQFLLESDDEDDLKLSKDCDGCAYFLSEMPCVFQVSDNTTPMDTPIGFCEHQSKIKGVRRDPSLYSQAALQTEMTLTVGHHRDQSTILKDKEKNEVPVAAAATGNDHPRREEETNGSGHLAAGSSRNEPKPEDSVPAQVDSSANGTGAACTDQALGTMTEASPDGDVLGESSLLLEEGSRNVPEENAQHAVCTLTESLRRNLFKLFNPIELCRYVSTIGHSLQAAAEGKDSRALSPSQEGVCSPQIPEETESRQMQAALCPAEEADKDSPWERKRTQGLPEQSQMPDENISFRSQGATLKSTTQNCENLCMEPRTEKEGIFRACERAGTRQFSAENSLLQVKNEDFQASSLPCAPGEKREGCHQQVFSGQKITSNGKKSKNAISPSPLWDLDSVPDKQECLCAVLSSAKLCDEPGQGEPRSDIPDSSNPDLLCSPPAHEAVSEAKPKSVLQSGEPECKGDADISAVYDKLWKLLHEDESDYGIPFETRDILSLGMRLTDTTVTELNFVQETCSDHPLPMGLIGEQEPSPEPAHSPTTETAGCSVPDVLLQRAAACESASIGSICPAQVLGTDGVCLDAGAGNERETPSLCVSATSVLLSTQECLDPNPTATDSHGSTMPWEGKLAANNAAQKCEADSPQRFHSAQSGDLACPKANPADISNMSHGTVGQLLHAECNIAMINESVPGEGCQFKDCYPARGELAHLPEEEDTFPSENTSQSTPAEHSAVNTIHKSYEVNLQEKGNLSGLNAPNDTNPDSYHLSKNNGCQDFQISSNAQEYSYVMQSPTLIQIDETITQNNVPQNTDQPTETAKQEGAVPPPSGEPFVRDFYLEVPSCDPCKPGGDQREICMPEEHRAETSCDSGVSQVSESQTAASPCTTAEQHSFFVDSTFKSDEELKTDSSQSPTCAAGSVASASAPLLREAPSEHHSTAGGEDGRSGDQPHSQQLLGNKRLPFLSPVSHSQGFPSDPAVVCPGTGSEGKTASVQTGVKVNRNLTALEIPCKPWQGLLQRVPGETKGEEALCENEREIPRAIECNPDEAETKAPLHTLTGSQALKQNMNISTEQSCPDLIPSSKITEAENSMKSTECDKKEEVRTAESGVNGLVNLPPVDSGNNQCFQEQPSHRSTLSVSLSWTTLDPFPVSTESQRNQEGSKPCQTPLLAAEPEPIQCKEDTAKSRHVAAGAKKKLPPASLSKKPRLEERGSVSKDPSCVKKSGKSEGGTIHKEDRKEQRKLIAKKDSKAAGAPRLLKKIQAELFPDCSGSIKLCCQFGDIHGDSTITWTKDSKVLSQLQRSAQDDSPVSLAIAEASSQDQGMYYCCLSNIYGKVTAEFHLTAAVLERLSSSQNYEGVEEIEFMQLMFREDPLSSSYLGGSVQGAIMTEGLHFGEGMHRRAFRSRVLQGLGPAFGPGHSCVLKVHSALTCGSPSRDELLHRNYSLALQECYVQNTAREYAKLYAAEAEPLEGFGEVPEIIPIFLIHRPANNIPYATVEEELVGEFVKYSVKDGKEVNFRRRDSEAGQKCCTFQHWVYEKTNGNLLVTDLQGVGMKLTDVGIATMAKGYKGFKGNCSFSFIEQFRALHQCNEYCEMLGLKSLRTTHQKQRKATSIKSKNLPNSSTVKKMVPKKAREPRDLISSEH